MFIRFRNININFYFFYILSTYCITIIILSAITIFYNALFLLVSKFLLIS